MHVQLKQTTATPQKLLPQIKGRAPGHGLYRVVDLNFKAKLFLGRTLDLALVAFVAMR